MRLSHCLSWNLPERAILRTSGNLKPRAEREPNEIKYMPAHNPAIYAGRTKDAPNTPRTPDNGNIAVLLKRESDTAAGQLALALKRASRRALLWSEEASELLAIGRPLTELEGIGPHLSKLIEGWIKSPPTMDIPTESQREFLTMAQATRILTKNRQWRANLKGDLHMHTNWSDGSAAIAEMARAAVDHGYRYISITDHTKGLKIARGLNEEELAAQGEEVNSVNNMLARQGVPLNILRSAEVNLSPTGEVDMEAKVLGKLDIVIGSFHSALRKTEDQTARYISALRNPGIQILGHPQGRVYNYRVGLSADWSRVFAEAAQLDKAVEIDGYADRQDLKVSLLKIARKEGARISLGTDAHHPWQLLFMDFSLAAACLARISPDRIINFMPVSQLKAWVSSVRSI
jgi:putative hydrolase